MTGLDTDGGVRVPAGYCGILGFRPSHGTVSLSGVLPVSGSLDTVGMYIHIFPVIHYKYTGYFEHFNIHNVIIVADVWKQYQNYHVRLERSIWFFSDSGRWH